MALFLVAPLAIVVACAPIDESSAPCSAEEGNCPKVAKTSNEISCACECKIGLEIVGTRTFEGRVDVCLPPDVNTNTATLEQRTQIATMSEQEYSQRVLEVCSDRVTSFVATLVRNQATDVRVSCIAPLRCSCAAQAIEETDRCRKPCDEVSCNSYNCTPLLREDDTLDFGACFCGRVQACGKTIPAPEQAALCRGEGSFKVREKGSSGPN